MRILKRSLAMLLAVLMLVSMATVGVSAAGDNDITIAFSNGYNWSEVRVYYWGSAGENPAWPGISMNKVTTNSSNQEVYIADIPADVTGIIFNGPKENDPKTIEQTPDITDWSATAGNNTGFYIYWNDTDKKTDYGTYNPYVEDVAKYMTVDNETELKMAVALGGTITLGSSFEVDEMIKIEKEVNINLNGKTITGTSAKKVFEVYANATFTNGTIVNTSGIAESRCVDTRKKVKLVLTDMNLTAEASNSQVLNIGGYDNGADVDLTNVTINAGKSGYGITTFVKTDLDATNVTASGYAALYVKAGSDESTFDFTGSTLTSVDAADNASFGTIVIQGANNVTVTVDKTSTVKAAGGEQALVVKDNTTGSTVTIKGAIVTDNGAVSEETVIYTEKQLKAAVALGGTITLGSSFEVDEMIKIEKEVNINLNGKTITGTSAKKVFEVYANATFTNGTIVNTYDGGRAVDTRAAVELTLNGVNLTATNGASQPLTIGGDANGTKVDIDNCAITGGTSSYAIITWVDTEMTIDNSTVTGWAALYNREDDLKATVTDSTLKSIGDHPGESNAFGVIGSTGDNDGVCEINVLGNSKVIATGVQNYIVFLGTEIGMPAKCDVTIADAVTVSTGYKYVAVYEKIADYTLKVPVSIADAVAAEGYVVDAAGYVSKTIKTVADLEAAAANGGEYILGADITVTETIVVAKDLTINGNYTLTAGGKLDPMLKVVEGGNLTVNDVTFDGAKTAICAASTRTSTSTVASYLTMNNVTVKNFATDGYGAVYNFGSSVATLNNCTFEDNTTTNAVVDEDNAEYSFASDVWAGAATNTTINGGTYEGSVFVNAYPNTAGTLEVKGDAVVEKVTLESASGNTAVLKKAVTATVNTIVDMTDANDGINTYAELKAAIEAGKTDIVITDNITMTKDTRVDKSFSLNLNGFTLTASGFKGSMFYVENKDAVITINNGTLDGNNTARFCIDTEVGGVSPINVKCVINMTDVTVQNFVGYDIVGALFLKGAPTANLTNCTFKNNSVPKSGIYAAGKDIWAGAAATVNIVGGSYEEIFMNTDSGSKSTITVAGDADVAELVLESTKGNVASLTNTSTGTVNVTDMNVVDGINTYAELKAAIDADQVEITLTGDITVTETLVVDSTIAISGDYTLTAGGKLDPMIKVVEGGNLTVNKVTFDGAKKAICAVSTRTSTSAVASYLTMNNVTVKNFANDGWGAVYNFGSSVATLNNCKFENNNLTNVSGEVDFADAADVWSGAATTLNINGGSYSDVYMNADAGSSSTINVDGGATITSLTLGYSTVSGKTAAANVKNGTVTALTDMVLDTTMTVQNDGNNFGSVINNRETYGNIELLGAQTRNDTEGADDMRFIAVADTELLEQADDYGFTFVNVGGMDVLAASKLAETLNPAKVAARGISCKESSNSVAGDYGKYGIDTEYKYVTGAITDIADADKDTRVLAMFYVTINGRTVLAPYYGDTATTSGFAASFNDAN